MITFAEACARIRKEEIEKELVHERDNDYHNNIKAFHSCRDRARAFGFRADEREQNFRSYTFVLNALNKKEKHKLSDSEVLTLEEEKTELIAAMADTPEDIVMAEQGITEYGWWAP